MSSKNYKERGYGLNLDVLTMSYQLGVPYPRRSRFENLELFPRWLPSDLSITSILIFCVGGKSCRISNRILQQMTKWPVWLLIMHTMSSNVRTFDVIIGCDSCSSPQHLDRTMSSILLLLYTCITCTEFHNDSVLLMTSVRDQSDVWSYDSSIFWYGVAWNLCIFTWNKSTSYKCECIPLSPSLLSGVAMLRWGLFCKVFAVVFGCCLSQ